jgi:CheY-like chemotaxis protein
MITIKDQGVGIAENNLSKIFDPYFSTKQTGRGLGLASTYSVIKKHHGHISVNSSQGKGTIFTIYLPASGKEIPVKEEPARLTGEGRILIMDDDKYLTEMMGDMLEILGYEAEFANDGAEAVALYKKGMESGKPYDAVILDLTVPGSMGGKDVIKILHEIDPKVKAVVSSGYSDDPVMSDFGEFGFKGMMPKPFDANVLGKVLNDVIKTTN